MTQQDNFFQEYFIQLRRECDAVRCEMNRFLYFALVILGAICFAVVQGEKAEHFFQHPFALLTEFASLIAITGLFWLRCLHLQQLADRWYILREIAHEHFNNGHRHKLHENVACGRLESTKGKAYLKQEWILNTALAAPIYVLIGITLFARTNISALLRLTICIILIALHIGGSYLLLYGSRTLKNPLKHKKTKKIVPIG